MYQALYRKFRPARFEDVKGQDPIVKTLKNQIISERIGHAYLFCGTRGTGKTTMAKLFAKAVNCENPNGGDPCGECTSCKAIAAGNSMNVIELDAASNNGVDSVRQIIDEVQYSPSNGKYKVYIVDEVHMLSPGAFNALLKTLEEPPSYVIFILATTEVNRLPITILSRCQRHDFRRISIEEIMGRMKELCGIEKINAEDRALEFIAKCADGSMRDALSLLDECISYYYEEELTYDKTLKVLGAVDNSTFRELFKIVNNGDAAGALKIIGRVIMEGRELTAFVSDFIWYLRNLLLVGVSSDVKSMIDVSDETFQGLIDDANSTNTDTIMRFINTMSELSSKIKYAPDKRVLTEVALIRLCRPEMETDLLSISQRLANVEKKLQDGNFTVITNPGAGGNGSSSETAQKKTSPVTKEQWEKELLPALPEDMQTILKNWGKVQSEVDGGARSALKQCRASVANDRLIIVAPDIEAKGFIDSDRNHTALQTALNKITGKSVSFKVDVERGEVYEHNLPGFKDILKFDYIEEIPE
ncbi:MAG: DNA polymerase III subunit gamma/tau [Lachnospiraceae bacterium]|nr:DNA polymerase III subunit gamma/tau [Lachnospiraceae bacterium]